MSDDATPTGRAVLELVRLAKQAVKLLLFIEMKLGSIDAKLDKKGNP